KVDGSNEDQTRFDILHFRTASGEIFKSLEKVKGQVATLHALAAGTTNADQSKQYSDLADNLDTIVAQQTSAADNMNGFADTADLEYLMRGSETEAQITQATGPSDVQSAKQMDQAAQQRRASGLGRTDIDGLATNVFYDQRDLRHALDDTENQTAVLVKTVVKSCAPPPRRQTPIH
ncbi:MAG: hypothetical protein JOZ38_11660, partial [Candidatus Eremiobacteraeota bacterium]|nr:hypothetical protein [Candidatus Eremiobacteraeota bacterium]